MRALLLLIATGLVSSGYASARFTEDSDFAKRGVLKTREVIGEDAILDSYDYVIAGGGLAGLVLASRLSANSSNAVLVLEAGLSGDAVADRINTPSGAYYASIVGTEYDWRHVTVPQTNLNGRSVSWPRGKILGGSTAMNAMYLVRPAREEVDAWQRVISSEDSDAARRWGWDEMYAAMRSVENFTEPLPQVAQVGNIQWNASSYGTGGPMSISYPAVMIEIIGNWTSSLNATGIHMQPSPNGGVTMGGFVTPSSINPTNWTRSYSRSAYIDSLPPRSNLHILPEATVNRLIFRPQASTDGWVANQVEFARSSDAPRRTVRVRREVILAGGSLGSLKILMHSGFGPRDVLQSANVTVIEELPGVGQHLQDHLTAGLVWESRLETAGTIQQSNTDFSKSREFLSFINDAVAFVNVSTLFGTGAGDLQRLIREARQTSVSTLVPSSDPEVAEGYGVVYDTLVDTFFNRTAQVEFLMSVISPNVVSFQAALQHPLSQGRLYINSSNPFDPIVIDPNYFAHFADLTILRQGVKLIRTLRGAFGNALGAELSPGPEVQTDEQWETWLRSRDGANSQFHPSSSCSMLPRAQGGVVDSRLRVYGAANVRVVDSSVFPFEFAAHLASATYGLAEQAAKIIQADPYTVPNSARTLVNPFTGTIICILFVTAMQSLV